LSRGFSFLILGRVRVVRLFSRCLVLALGLVLLVLVLFAVGVGGFLTSSLVELDGLVLFIRAIVEKSFVLAHRL